ncbi:hypothetical protein [Aquimarina sp. MMG016]|uniref:hypothetical protein n=1 Tax=Aquimarina sp. MMG016 TaxID=2822690 RepID=UPI001B39D0C9|nr:hypothetical protein [Aquimarina sp. MMG016]MBQ4819756.1 hypothetical protein [Aquimarina sp. MMG016]
MEFIEKHKALIITSMLMGIFVLSLYNINMMAKQKEQSEILMEIPEELLEELTKEEEEPQPQEDRELIASKRTHNAYNEDFEDHDEIEERIKSLTEAEEEEQTDETPEEEQPAIEEAKEEKPKPEPEETNSKYSSSSWSLKGRELMGKIPNPVYTCNGSGKVVVKIKVNQNGYVINTKIDKRNSTTRNECLFDNAMKYARQALFSRSSIEEQQGLVTYYFNYSN